MAPTEFDGRWERSEVLREGLRLIERREMEDEARLKNLREAVRLGVADIEAGRYRDLESPSELESHLRKLVTKSITASRKK